MTILIDADACPVISIAEAFKTNIPAAFEDALNRLPTAT